MERCRGAEEKGVAGWEAGGCGGGAARCCRGAASLGVGLRGDQLVVGVQEG